VYRLGGLHGKENEKKSLVGVRKSMKGDTRGRGEGSTVRGNRRFDA